MFLYAEKVLKLFSFRALTLRFCDRNGIRQLITCVHLPISIGSLPETIEKANQWEHLTDLKKGQVKMEWWGNNTHNYGGPVTANRPNSFCVSVNLWVCKITFELLLTVNDRLHAYQLLPKNKHDRKNSNFWFVFGHKQPTKHLSPTKDLYGSTIITGYEYNSLSKTIQPLYGVQFIRTYGSVGEYCSCVNDTT